MPDQNVDSSGPTPDLQHRDFANAISRHTGFSSAHFLRLIEEKGNVGFWTSYFSTGNVTASIGINRLLDLQAVVKPRFEDLLSLMHPDDRAAHENMKELVHAGQPINREFRIIRHDGAVRWIQNKADVILDAAGKPVRAIGVIFDVTELHEARTSVVEGWQKYKTLVSAIAPIQWRNLPNGDVTHRQGYETLLADFLLQRDSWLDLLHPDDRDSARLAWETSLATGKAYAADFRVRCLDGEYRSFLARAAPISNADGTIREWLGVLIECDAKKSNIPPPPLDNLRLDARHIRAARASLNWSVRDLSLKAGISVSTIKRMESKDEPLVRVQHLKTVLDVLKKHGVIFAYDDDLRVTITFE